MGKGEEQCAYLFEERLWARGCFFIVTELDSTSLYVMRLPARIGHVRAYAMFAPGGPLNAANALACGLANAVVTAAELRARARQAAETLTKRPAGSLSHTKTLMRDSDRIAAKIAEESQIFRERLLTPEALAAFAERRQPDFSKPATD